MASFATAPSFTTTSDLPAPSAPSKPKARRRNQYAAPCSLCGERVAEGEGYLSNVGGKWLTEHVQPCPEPTAAPLAPTTIVGNEQPPRTPVFDGIYTVEREDGHRTLRLRTQASDASFMPGKQVIAFLSGLDNENDYTGFGTINFDGTLRVWSKHKNNAPLIADANLLLQNPQSAMTAAHCYMCHRLLTVPTSLHMGLGPECAKKVAS